MKKFVRQMKAGTAPVDVTVDFGAAAGKIARIFEPGEYKLKIEAARVIAHDQNVSIALDLVETESGGRVASRPVWVDGPQAGVGNLAAENQHLIAQLLTLAKLPTSGNVATLIPKLAGLAFNGQLVLAVDNRSGRAFNAIADVFAEEVL